MIALAALVVALSAGMLAAELRRRDAERRADAARADAVRLLLRVEELTRDADLHLTRHVGVLPLRYTTGDLSEDLQLGASAAWSASRIAREGAHIIRG